MEFSTIYIHVENFSFLSFLRPFHPWRLFWKQSRGAFIQKEGSLFITKVGYTRILLDVRQCLWSWGSEKQQGRLTAVPDVKNKRK